MLQPDTIRTLHDSIKVLPKVFPKAIPDSLATDSLARVDSLATADSLHLVDSLRRIALIPRGFIGIPHPSLPQTESWVFVLLFILFFLLVYAILQSSGFIIDTVKTFFQVKERSSIFSKATVNDSRSRFFLIVFSISVLSMYAYCVVHGQNTGFMFKEYACFWVITAIFFALKNLIFDVMGYVFLAPVSKKMTKDSYFNVLSILGIVMYPLLILQIYIPNNYTNIVEITGLVVCVIACILVIIKLFQIFFRKIVASFYILLYLCTLEFLPLFLLYQVFRFVLRSV